MTEGSCFYCGEPSESIDHIHPRSRGGCSSTENCVPACLGCNGSKGDLEAFAWYRRQSFYDPRRARALQAWIDGDLRLATKLLQWSASGSAKVRDGGGRPCDEGEGAERRRRQAAAHQTRQAAAPLWRWQIAS